MLVEYGQIVLRAERLLFKGLRDEFVFTFSLAFLGMSMTKMYGRQLLAVDLKNIRRKSCDPRKLISQKKNELGFHKFHCSRRNSLTDSENSQISSQSSLSFSSSEDKKMTYWSIQRSKQTQLLIHNLNYYYFARCWSS